MKLPDKIRAWLKGGVSVNYAAALEHLPALAILIGVINGIFPAVVFPGLDFWHMLLFCLPLAALAFLLLPRSKAVIFLVASLCGGGALLLQLAWQSESFLKYLGGRDRGAEIVVRISDTSCCGAQIKWLQNPSLIEAEVVTVRIAGETEKKTFGRVALRLPDDAPRVFYGNRLRLRGTFRLPDTRINYALNRVFPAAAKKTVRSVEETIPLPGAVNFVDYLRARKMRRIFQAREVLGFSSGSPAVYGQLLRLRNWLLLKAGEQIEQVKDKRILATLLFGCRQGLDWKTRYAYVESGTIHIFTVSGLHVAILTLILLWFLRWAPFRVRYLIIPVIITLYAAATGMHPPASRALLMLVIWCLCRAFLLHIPALNIVFLSASLLLLRNPFYLKDMGFQFSFLVVGFLIAAADSANEWSKFPGEMLNWVPPVKRHWATALKEKWLSKLNLTFVGCVTAWLASSGICLYYQGIYFPFSIIANFVLIPFVWLLFNFVFWKIIISPMPFIASLAAGAVTSLLYAVNGIIMFANKIFESTNVVRPSIASLLLFYALLMLLVSAKKHLTFYLGLAGIIGTVVFWHVANWFMPPSVTFLRGGQSSLQSIVICEPYRQAATIVNVPSFEAAKSIASLLSEKGIRVIDRVVFTGVRKECAAGAETLLSRLKARKIIQLEPKTRSRVFKNIVLDAVSSGQSFAAGKWSKDHDSVSYREPQLTIIRKNKELRIEYHSAVFNIKITDTEKHSGRTVTVMQTENYRPIKFESLNSSMLEMREYNFEN